LRNDVGGFQPGEGGAHALASRHEPWWKPLGAEVIGSVEEIVAEEVRGSILTRH
jgi:hypothetical protein